MVKPQLILASASPGRLELLRQAGIVPDKVEPADIDETPRTKESPRRYALRLAEEKAAKIAVKNPESFIIAADTIVLSGTRLIGKAADETEAREILKILSGKRHMVVTAVCVMSPGSGKSSRIVETRVKIGKLTDAEIEDYITSSEWRGKSGCYTLHGRAGRYIEWLNGSYSGVIGLPLAETLRMLQGLGFKAS